LLPARVQVADDGCAQRFDCALETGRSADRKGFCVASLESSCETIGFCGNRRRLTLAGGGFPDKKYQPVWSTRREKFRLDCS